jgi:hypothetical protein
MIHIGKPKIDRRPKIIYMGIRTITPFKGMFKVIDTMSKRMNAWVIDNKIKTVGSLEADRPLFDTYRCFVISTSVPLSCHFDERPAFLSFRRTK